MDKLEFFIYILFFRKYLLESDYKSYLAFIKVKAQLILHAKHLERRQKLLWNLLSKDSSRILPTATLRSKSLYCSVWIIVNLTKRLFFQKCGRKKNTYLEKQKWTIYIFEKIQTTSKTHRVKIEEKDHQLLWDAHKHHIIVDLKSVRPNSSVPQWAISFG